MLLIPFLHINCTEKVMMMEETLCCWFWLHIFRHIIYLHTCHSSLHTTVYCACYCEIYSWNRSTLPRADMLLTSTTGQTKMCREKSNTRFFFQNCIYVCHNCLYSILEALWHWNSCLVYMLKLERKKPR